MKHLLPFVLLLATFSTALADTPAKIAEDYRKAAAAALTKVNGMLESAATPLIAKLVTSGDTTGAEQLTEQLKAKLAGEPVATPQASATLLFAQYDQARTKALEPAQKASISRIDSLLKSAGKPSLETVTELTKVRAEIEAGKVENESPLPVEWIYKRTPNDRDEAKILLNAGGRFLIDNGSIKKTGSWRRSADKSGITVQLEDGEKWTVEITDGIGKIQCPSGIRYMVAK
jgi:hypothetical protein